MSLKTIATIAIPDSAGSSFDHGAFDPATRRVFVAHTGRSCVEVIDHDAGKHVATLPDFPEAAGVVADGGMVLVTNRGAASMAWVDARSLKTQRVFNVGTRPNGVAIVARQKLAIAACIRDDNQRPTLHAVGLDGGAHHTIELPGRPRWCVTDASATRVFLAIQEPSMVLSARLPDLQDIKHLKGAGRRRTRAGDRSPGWPPLRRVRRRCAGGSRCRHGQGLQPVADRRRSGCDIFQSHDRIRSRRHRQAGTGPIDRSPHRRQHPNDDGSGGSHNGLGAAEPALRVFTIGRRSHCPCRWLAGRTFQLRNSGARKQRATARNGGS